MLEQEYSRSVLRSALNLERENPMDSYKVEVNTAGDPPDSWASNALRFKTESDAQVYALDLALRWTAVRDWRVAESDEEPNR